MRRGLYELSLCAGGLALVGLALPAKGAINVDGLLDAGYGSPLATQTINTGFGDNANTDGNTANGSELDAAYGVVQSGTGVLNLFFSGNVETNFNHLNIFIADGRTGQSTLNAQGSISSMNGSTFSPGFVATYALDINGGPQNTNPPIANPPTWYANTNDLHQSNGPSTYIGSYTPPSTTAQHDTGQFINNGVASGVFIGVDNSNVAGVNGNSGTAADPTAADAVTTGLEVSIPLSVLGNPHGSVEVLADINGGGNNYLSNQFLPGLPVGTADLGATSGGKFSFAGTSNEFFTVVVPPGNNTNGNWINTAGGSWNTSANWANGAIPGVAGDTATFASATGPSPVTLDGNRTLGQITFNSSSSYTISAGSGGTLTIDDTGDSEGVNPFIEVSAGSQTISAPISLPSTVSLSVTSGASLSLSGNISGAGGLTQTGAGTTYLSGTNTFGGLTIQAGTVELDNVAGAGTLTIALGNPIADLVPATLAIGSSGMTISNSIITNPDDSGSDSQRIIAANYTSGNSTVSGAITLNGGLELTAPAGATLTISGLIANGNNPSSTVKYDVLVNSAGQGGTVVLSNSNTYTGLTAVDSGTLLLANSSAAGNLMSGVGNIFVGNGGPTLANNNASLLATTAGETIVNPIITNKSDTGTGVGTGTRTIGGTNTSGNVTFSGGLALNGGAVLAAAAGGTVSFTSPIANGTDAGNTSYDVTIPGPGNVVLSAANTYSGNTFVTGGSLSVAAGGSLPASTNLTVSNGASATFAAVNGSGLQNVTLGSLTINSGTVTMQTATAHGDRSVYSLGGLTIAQTTPAAGNTPAVWAGKLDVGGNDLFIEPGPNTSLATVTAQLQSGFAAGTGYWNGSSGIVSSAAQNDTTHLTTLGVMQDSFGDVMVKYTYYGDADLNGTVNGADYQQIDLGFGMHLTGWQNGDFNYDGVVDGADYALIDNTFNQITATGASPLALLGSDLIASPAAVSAVPEPAALGLLGIGAFGLLGHRRRRNA